MRKRKGEASQTLIRSVRVVFSFAACDTRQEAEASANCPDGNSTTTGPCIDAYNAFRAGCLVESGSGGGGGMRSWNETSDQAFPALLGRAWGVNSLDVYELWGMDSDMTMPASVEGYVRFGTLANRLASRCEWEGYYGTCEYSYVLALEAALSPGEALGYNCTMMADRDDCSD
eukprot:SAG22_NODE_5719_length_965_cov_1.381062_1_plen_172_part_01